MKNTRDIKLVNIMAFERNTHSQKMKRFNTAWRLHMKLAERQAKNV